MSRYLPDLPRRYRSRMPSRQMGAPCYCGCGQVMLTPWLCTNPECRYRLPLHHCGRIHYHECPHCGEPHRAPVTKLCGSPAASGAAGYRRTFVPGKPRPTEKQVRAEAKRQRRLLPPPLPSRPGTHCNCENLACENAGLHVAGNCPTPAGMAYISDLGPLCDACAQRIGPEYLIVTPAGRRVEEIRAEQHARSSAAPPSATMRACDDCGQGVGTHPIKCKCGYWFRLSGGRQARLCDDCFHQHERRRREGLMECPECSLDPQD